MDMEIDTGKLDIFGTIITQVKMEGRVPASTHLVYDCSHGEWLLAQMAYDRKIRLFSSRCSPGDSQDLRLQDYAVLNLYYTAVSRIDSLPPGASLLRMTQFRLGTNGLQ